MGRWKNILYYNTRKKPMLWSYRIRFFAHIGALFRKNGLKHKKLPARRALRKGISATRRGNFPDWKVKYCSRNAKFASQAAGLLRNDSKITPEFRWNSGVSSHFRRKYITGEGYFTRRKTYFTDLRCKSISLRAVHIPMGSTQRAGSSWYQATSHLYFSTLYRGMKGTRMGTVLTYFWYSGSLP